MANILSDGANWNDTYSSPTSTWNGTTYDVIGSDNGGPAFMYYSGFKMSYGGTIAAGDIVDLSVTSTSADPTEFSVLINDVAVFEQVMETGQAYDFTSDALSPDDNVQVYVGVGDYLYSQDAVITPNSESSSLFAPDLSVSVPQNSQVSVSPQLTLDSADVSATGYSIITHATNGSATASTTQLTYAPNQDYNGTDSFQYQGTALDGTVDSVVITAGGIAYTSAPTVTFGSPISGTQAQGTATVAGGKVTGVTITNHGSGYTSAPVVNFGAGVGTGAAAVAVMGNITSNVANVNVTVIKTPCQEMGRVTRCYVSAYQRNREHCSNVSSREKRCLIADFNGAIPVGRTITSVTWSCLNPYIVNMMDADVTDRETACVILCQYGGVSLIRCDATLSNGEVYVQMFRLNISQPVWFQGDTPFSQGPYTLTAVPA